MATVNTTARHTKARAKDAAAGDYVRDRVRELSVAAFRDRKLSLSDVPKLVHEVLEGAVESVDSSIPKSGHNVLREVFDGLSEGVHAVSTAGAATVKDARERGRALAGRAATSAAHRMQAANEEFIAAVKSFAGKASRQVKEELDLLVAQAEKTGPKVADSARKVAKAADGRLIELSGETARAGARAVRRAAGALAMGAGGLMEGLAEAISPKAEPAAARQTKAGASRTGKKKPAGKKTAASKTRNKAVAKRR